MDLNMSPAARAGLADVLDQLADGKRVELGAFGDAGSTTDADEQADVLRQIADELKH